MAKFLNKKEQVFSIELTPYGRHKMSMGTFEPVYYGFFDDNVIYDGAYAGLTESQNQIGQRIKHETQYLEPLVLFEGVEAELQRNSPGQTFTEAENYFEVDVDPYQIIPRKDSYRYTNMIGDAYLDGEQQAAPAWKIVALNGDIGTSTTKDEKNNIDIPQINITLNYEKNIVPYDPEKDITAEKFRNTIARTFPFSDGNIIEFVSDDLMIYAEELNTDMLTENFDIEIFEIEEDNSTPPRSYDNFLRKYFKTDHQRIMGGMITEKTLNDLDPITDDVRDLNFNYTTSSVGYYFDVLRDYQIDPVVACKNAEVFNKESFFVDLDFDCSEIVEGTNYYMDLYGPVTEPEIC
jgi:hypothetical protein